MEDRFEAVEEHVRAAVPRLTIADETRVHCDESPAARSVSEDLLLMETARVNILITGQDDAVRPVLETLLEAVPKPIATWSPGEPLALPSLDRSGTLVLHEVGSLGLREQIQLLEWSGLAMGSIQVISTASTPLLPRVSAGAFIDTLYYRLNTVYVDVTGARPVGG